MSRWLHDHVSLQTAHLRLSLPFGGLDLSASAVRRVVFRAGGIGITPALSWLTRLAEKELPESSVQSCEITWWARFEPESELVARVRNLAELARWRGFDVDLSLIDTSEAGRRASEKEWQDWLADACDPDSDHIHICGPIGFMDCAARALDAVDWPRSKRTIESFCAAPGAGACAAARPVYRVPDFNPLDEPVVASSFSLQQASDRTRILHEAKAFLRQFYFEEGAPVPIEDRLAQIATSIEANGTYVQTEAEMEFGARVAWRNSARCIGRFFWKSLAVRDLRQLDAINDEALAAAVFEEIRAHLSQATNGGDLRATITVFRPHMAERPSIRIINPQVILYAGYRNADGSVIGDPANIDLTDLAQALGWESPRTRFDVLPVMIRIGEGVPHLFELPKDEVLEVSMSHPEVDAVASLGLQWFAVPAVSDLALDMGGLVYPAAPSNGFYMSTEIGSFNLSDPQRYDLLGAIAEAIGLDTGLDNPLWRDRALVEINRMVLHSFREAGVRIMDHHALSEWFERFRADETEQGRPVYGHWPWIVPPMSANLSRVWHDVSLRKIILKPNYFYQKRRADILACLAQARGG
jgi:nitric-oxide synthase